ncbi:dimethylamine monooxygenase subunit DmmA family protein (plasmid) [Acinetobacter sp. ANC 7454]|uniref:Dimethylamine monooxygenase subunit DmmA-like C-terminal domain-containing protein n=1 Tax=Acinetobacter baumannii TaxID=470 RepID=A0A9Q8L3S2_ACIBA|nr:dimethylamine monooxygenase subunit DmmA family protein [Acinetobacter sp. HR7]KGT47458.1 hypothetical protein GW12_15060 [Acinetobacter sp. HR7]UAA86680.1 hypothetical protein H2787_17545 [Acinetobacter baumannii]
MSTAMFSTPNYQNYTDIHPSAAGYLILLEQQDDVLVQQVLGLIPADVRTQVIVQHQTDDAALAKFLNSVTQALQLEKAGIHSVVIGSESFIWMTHQCLQGLGCLKEEMTLVLNHRAGQKRNVYCVHCGHQQQTEEEECCTCEHCHVHLFIRSHFSQRLGAYMGVCANAYDPMGVAS